MVKPVTHKKTYPTMLAVAGSDPSGGAGILADVKTATALGVYAMNAITAVTAQNTTGVRSWASVGTDMLAAQLDAVFDDITVDAVKLGMIPDAAMVDVIRDRLVRNRVTNLVVDPVCVATSGDALTADSVPGALVRLLFPIATVVTPNLPEAGIILGRDVDGENPVDVAREIQRTTHTRYVLLKGGHARGADCTDILVSSDNVYSYTSPRIDTPNTHGTGCTMSSAIASFLALGFDVPTAVEKAHRWLHAAIASGAGYTLGHGHGPVNHLFEINKYEH